MKYLLALCVSLWAVPAWSQPPQPTSQRSIANPFDQPIDSGGGGMEMGMDDDMGMGMGMGMEAPPSPDQLFRANLPRAIQRLKQAKTPEEKQTLQKFIRDAFEQRYDRLMEARKQDIVRLQKSLTELESDLKRRGAAKDRVVQLQLQSVQLAAEGLLELNDLQGVGGGSDYGMGGGMGGGGQF